MSMSMEQLISVEDPPSATSDVGPLSDLNSEFVSRQALELIAEGITELVGFELSAISVIGCGLRFSRFCPPLTVTGELQTAKPLPVVVTPNR